VKNQKKKRSSPFGSGSWYDPADWSYHPSTGFRATLRAIPLILVLLLGFSLGLTSIRGSAGTGNRLIDRLGGANKAQLDEAYSLILSGDYTGACSLASAVIRVDPESSLAYHIVGLAHAYRGLTEEAAVSFQKATELDPEFAVAWHDLGVVEESRGEFQSALDAYRRAAELEPATATYVDAARRVERIVLGEGGWDWRENEAGRLFLEGVSAVSRGGADDLLYAENVFRSLVRDRPYDVASRNMLGLTLVRQGRLDEAEQVLIQVVELEPGFSDAWYNLGMLHRAQGRLEQALEDFQVAYSSSSLGTFKAISQRQISEIRTILESEAALAPPAQPETDAETDVRDE